MALSPQQQAFVHAYIASADKNATHAATQAGYRHPRQAGSRLLSNVDIQALIQQMLTIAAKSAIADQQRRIAAKQRRWEKLERVVQERAADPSMHGVPGGQTGLIVRQWKGAGMQLREEYALDTGLLAEFSRLENDTGKELGQIVDKAEVGGSDGKPLTFTIVIDRRDANEDQSANS